MLTTAYVGGVKISIKDYVKPTGTGDAIQHPVCSLGHKLVAKQGTQLVHHFAHYPGDVCYAPNKMSTWHSQWQGIVADLQNIEVCLSREGAVLGHSSFHGQQNFQSPLSAQLNGHIADIIKPSPPGYRHLVVELQHSSISPEDVKEREAYYQYMIWVFDFTPRIVPKGKHNKLVMVDGKLSYLKDKIRYLAFVTSRSPRAVFPSQEGWSAGDQVLLDQPTPIGGAFVIATTKTKYWFEATKPSYFDAGFGILRLLSRLDKNCALYLLLSYEDFFRERMPSVDKEKLKACAWFHSADHLDLLKMGILPKPIDVPEILVCKDRVILKSAGIELDGLGFERGIDEWHWGAYYEKLKTAELKSLAGTPNSNESILLGWLNGAKAGNLVTPDGAANNEEKNLVLLKTKLKHFLGSSSLEIEVLPKKGGDIVIVYCDHNTYGMKEKFAALGMTYRKGKGTGGAGVSSRQSAKKTSSTLADMVRSAQRMNESRGNDNNEPIHGFSGTPAKAEGAAVKNGETRTHYRAKLKDVQGRLNSIFT